MKVAFASPSRKRAFHALTVGEVARRFETNVATGLDQGEVAQRLALLGPNKLPPPRRQGLPRRALRQLAEPMALLLVVAAAVAGIGLGETTNAAAILAIVVLNMTIGLLEEGKASRALDALRRLEVPTARVRRGGRTLRVPAAGLVPGDVIALAAGEHVPADARLAEATALATDESTLTGESLPVDKDATGLVRADAPLAERFTMVFAGTTVVRGTGAAIIVATGPSSELGTIAHGLEARWATTPLMRELARLSRWLGAIAVITAAGVFLGILWRAGVDRRSLQQALLAAIALAVAAVPEGLATAVVLALALGVKRMAQRGAIVRRLAAVETLGRATVILTDKTGTLTENRLSLERFLLPDPRTAADAPAGDDVMLAAALCNDAVIEPPAGDPVDTALVAAVGSRRAAALRAAHPRLAAVPFEPSRRRMTTLHRDGDGVLLHVKGAPEVVLACSTTALTASGRVEPILDDEREAILERAAAEARRGVRLLALAARHLPEPPTSLYEAERDMTLLALAVLRDPLRPAAARAVADARAAGISVVVVTGDHAGTASFVAGEIGLLGPGTRVVTGAELRQDGIPDDPLCAAAYARVDPDQKLALVEALTSRGHVVAVTGDGINDAPALRRADIGVAMGRGGTEVAREAADLVVTDDDLATIVDAVREGRGIYDNIRKVVDYLVAGNLSEILVVVAGLVFFPALGVPLLPLQLLWINLLTDGAPALALATEPIARSLAILPPRRKDERLTSARRISRLGLRAVLIAGASIASLVLEALWWGEPWAHARAVMFSVLVVAHLLYAFAARRPRDHALVVAPGKWLVVGVGIGLVLQVGVISWPAARDVIGASPLALRDWAVIVVCGAAPLALMSMRWPRVRVRAD